MRIYLDSSPVIYYVEGILAYWDKIVSILEPDNVRRVASDVTRLECRMKPIRESNETLIDEFDLFFEGAEIVPLTTDVVDLATLYQAHHRYTTPDALHLAAAVVADCDIFLTNDRRLSSFPEMTVELID